MSVYSGPSIIVDSSVVKIVDVANQKSFPKANTINNHGYSTWYCFVTGTATYSIIDPNITIFENNAGTITTMVSPSSLPQRGTITVTAGRTYYGNGAIYLVVEDQHHYVAPLSMVGTEFMWHTSRNNPGTVYIYAPTNTTVSFYNNPTNGFDSTPTSVINLAAGTSTTINLPDIVNYYLKSTEPILAATTQNGADKTILSPMTNIVYNRYLRDGKTSINTTPVLISGNVVYDPVYTVMDTTIADGSGTDCAQALGLSFLSSTYSFGNAVSDYGIAAPYDGTTVVVSYWNGSAWVILETHTLNGGTETVPTYQFRDGNTGVGNAGTVISGAAAYFAAGATGPWRWVGNKPFYLNINDTADDELSMLGWPGYLSDISGKGNNGVLTNSPTYNSSNGGALVFNGTNNYLSVINSSSLQVGETFSISAWVYPTNLSSRYGIFSTRTANASGSWQLELGTASAGTGRIAVTGVGTWIWESSSDVISVNNFYNITYVKPNNATQGGSLYLNGRLLSPLVTTAYTILNNNDAKSVGAGTNISQFFPGNIYSVLLYNRALSANEVLQNFNALRGRFNI